MTFLVFGIVRELLFNVEKHAGTWEARLEVEQVGDRLEIRVKDAGDGFDPGVVEAPGGGTRITLDGLVARD